MKNKMAKGDQIEVSVGRTEGSWMCTKMCRHTCVLPRERRRASNKPLNHKL